MKKFIIISILSVLAFAPKVQAQATLAHLTETFIQDTLKPGATDSILYFTSGYELEAEYDLSVTLVCDQLQAQRQGQHIYNIVLKHPRRGLTIPVQH